MRLVGNSLVVEDEEEIRVVKFLIPMEQRQEVFATMKAIIRHKEKDKEKASG